MVWLKTDNLHFSYVNVETRRWIPVTSCACIGALYFNPFCDQNSPCAD